MTVRMSPIVADSLADTRALSRLGMAIAAMMPMIATTIRSSMRVKPDCSVLMGRLESLGYLPVIRCPAPGPGWPDASPVADDGESSEPGPQYLPPEPTCARGRCRGATTEAISLPTGPDGGPISLRKHG